MQMVLRLANKQPLHLNIKLFMLQFVYGLKMS